jgi:hypothetical protein
MLFKFFVGAFTPIRYILYKVITIMAGEIISVCLFCLKLFVAKIQYTIEKYFNILSAAFLILLIVGFLTLKCFDLFLLTEQCFYYIYIIINNDDYLLIQ